MIDITWGLGFACVAAVMVVWSIGDGDNTRRTLVTVLVALWGLRLATYIALRSRGHGEDPRYAEILDRASGPDESGGRRAVRALVSLYLPQAVSLWFVSLPVQVAMFERSTPGALIWIGTALWAVGICFEAVGDWQMQRFRADPAGRGQVMDRGLWRYTRHPNYFGDACVWWGLYLVAAQQAVGALTILSPLAMTYFLVNKTGKPLLEAALVQRRPGYAQYVERTSGFVPRPPKRG